MLGTAAVDPSYDFLRHDLAFLLAENEKKPIDPPKGLISTWVQGHRVLPSNTPFPGFWDNDKTPYLVEPMDNMAPFSPVLITSVMKGVQLGLTAAAENVIGYFMQELPVEILYASATDELLEKWSSKRLDPLIDSIGMRDKISAQMDPAKAKSRRSGDKVLSKEYPGGTLNMASAQSAAGLRSDSKRVLVLDEVDGAPRLLKTGEGNWLDVAYGRTAAWGARAKILEFSTPTTFEDSLIRERYEKGDQRKFHVPCVHCGVMQVLEFKHLKWEKNPDGQLHKVWYECPHCMGHMFNHHKTQMLRAGEWVPTAKPTTRGHRSYHISSLYSPVGMLTWYKMVEKFLEAQMTPGGMRSFVNLFLGEAYKEKGSRPKIEKVIELRGEYLDNGMVPDGVLFVTAGVDVQAGSGWNYEENCPKDPNNPPRLEMEILGHGSQFRTWSLAYLRFEGPTTDPHAGAWEAMQLWAQQGGLVRKRADGMEFPVNMVFIDSGDGNNTDVVYTFTTRWKNTFPSKGFNALVKRKEEKGDEAGPSNFKRYRSVRLERSGEMVLYEISTNYYKSWTYTNLGIPRQDFEPQKPGFCSFPRDRSEKFFLMLTAEEKRSDGSFHAGGRRNEALDCRVMALCAGDVFLDAKVAGYRAAAKTKGLTDLEIQKFDHAFVLEVLRKQTARRPQ